MTVRNRSLACRPFPWRCVGAVACAGLTLLPSAAWAATYYVAPTGNNSNPGTIDQPFATMARGQQAAMPGDTVYFRAGTYRFTSSSAANGVLLDKSGTAGNLIKYWSYQNEVPVFDFSGMTAAARITGLRVTGSYIHLKGFEIKLVPQNITTENESWGIYNLGNNNVYEMLNLHHNMGPGFFLGGGRDNLILNCDSHHNYDPKSRAGDGENADGFGCHTRAGDTGNVFRGVRAWWNTDDGYDSINAQEACLVEYSWAWYNGYVPDTMNEPMRDPTLPPGNGNGFKLGGFGITGSGSPATPPKHTIRFSVAFANVFAGFFANYHTGGHFFYNNTGFKNVGADFNMLGLTANTSVLRNNVAYGPSPTANMNGTDQMGNSWSIAGIQVSDADFQSISFSGMDGPRNGDGSLPVLGFMRLQPGSDLIDKGTNIGLPFTGTAPDLGAFEAGAVVGGGGAGGAGGTGMSGAGPGGAGGAGGIGGAPGVSAGAGGAGVLAGSSGLGGVGGVGGIAAAGTSGGGAAPPSAGSAGTLTGGAATLGGSTAAGAAASGAGMSASRGGAPSGGQMDGTPDSDAAEEGCGCRVTGAPRSSGAFAAAAAALLGLALRRRQQR